jgi:hypothetical protein
MEKTKVAVTLDTFDVIWILSVLGFWVICGADASALWFALFGLLMAYWFLGPMLDRWASRTAERNHQAWRKEKGIAQ